MSSFHQIKFRNSAKQTLRQIYGVIFYLNKGFNHIEAIKKAVHDFPSVNDYQTISDKCARRFAGNVPSFLEWYRHGLILNRLKSKFNLNDEDYLHFQKLLSSNSNETLNNESSKENIGAGFGNPETNKDVEKAAIEKVTKLYENKGWSVESVESENLGFDLICTTDISVLNVEVKGISGLQESFILTRNEFNQIGKNENFLLCIVLNALSDNPKVVEYDQHKLKELFHFEPLQYHVRKK
ncbi:MAG: DUF3883 domain-containing protein [Balneolales bacterium]